MAASGSSAPPPESGGANTAESAGANTAESADTTSNEAGCSIAATLDIIGDRWTLLVLRDVFRGVRRFSDLVEDLGIAKNLLSDRLKRLTEHGVIERVPYQNRPVRYEYRLTRKGAELSPALIALMHWGDRWCLGGQPPVTLIHDRCGTALEHHVVCPHCDASVAPGQVRSRQPAISAHSHPVATEPGAASAAFPSKGVTS